MPAKAEVIWKGDEVFVRLRNTAWNNLRLAAVFLKGQVKRKLSGGRSGRVYRVPGTKTLYTASAPGEAPASRTGTLRNAVQFQVNKADMEALVGPRALGGNSNTPEGYPFWLEFGTKKMSPRPYMRPAFEESKGDLIRIMKEGWE